MIRIISVVVFMGTTYHYPEGSSIKPDNIEVAALSGGANDHTAERAYVSSAKPT